MAKFQVGTRVMMADTKKKGVITAVSDYCRGRQYYLVNWGDCEGEELEIELIEDCDISNVFERCKRGLFGSYSEFAQKNTSSKIQSSNNSSISSLAASRTLFRTYQFKPLLKFLNSPNRRLLVADEVGLGKTIEAGHIMMELKARRTLRNVVIICPKALQIKWREELKEKFGIPFKIYESHKDLIEDFESRDGTVRAIINYEKIRLVESKEKKKTPDSKPSNIIDYLEKNDRRLSLVLCDEAHRLRNNDTKTYKGAMTVMNRADAAVFLTATPIMLGTDNLFNLLHLLDETKYFNYQIFNARLQENAPFVRAITAINNRIPLSDIAYQLTTEQIRTTYANKAGEVIYSLSRSVDEVYKNDPIYLEVKERLLTDDTDANRARLQYLLNSLSVINNIFSRTRKKDVMTDMSQAQRKPNPQKIVLNEDEQEQFDEVIENYIDDNSYTDDWGEEKLSAGAALGLVQKKRQIASSVYGYLNTEEDLDQGIDRYEEFEDAKVQRLVEIIEEVFAHGTRKLIVFAVFQKTLKYLAIRLRKKGYNSLVIHGGVDNRDEILEQFRDDPNNHILLSSEVGSEGLDMQFCDSMVNYDLPWNPMVVEQRIGRIDRFGQKSPVVNIYNFIVAGSIQEDIYMRLLERIGIFRGTIGDMEAILDSPIREGSTKTIKDVYNETERALYTSELTKEERQNLIDTIRLAYEKQKQSIEELETGLTNTLTNDAYFKQEIDRIRNNKDYVTEKELKNYVEALIEQGLPTHKLKDLGNDVYEIERPISNRNEFSRFLSNHQPIGEDNEVSFRRFRQSLEDMNRILVTFNQNKAYNNHSLIFLNIYHPIIQACLHYFSANRNESNKTFCFSLPERDEFQKGSTFYLCVYRYITSRVVQGVEKKSENLIPYVYDVVNKRLEEDEDVVRRLYSVCQENGNEYSPSATLFDGELVEEMRMTFLETSTAERKRRQKELESEAESERQHSEAQTKEYYQIGIEKLQYLIAERESLIASQYVDETTRQNAIRILSADKGRLEKNQRELQEKLDIINRDPEISVVCEPMSLALIKIV